MKKPKEKSPPKRPRGKCPQMIGFLEAYVDGTLGKGLRRRFDKHLSDCPGCVAFLHTYAATRRFARRALTPTGIPPALRDRVLALLREAAGCGKPVIPSSGRASGRRRSRS